MATLTDQTAAVIDYLVAQCSASPSLGAASPRVSVFDGPTSSATQLVAGQRVWIGAEGYTEPGLPVEAAVFSQSWPVMDHARTRDDQIDVACAAEYFTGDPTAMKQARDGAFALVGVIETMLRGDTAGGGPGDATMGGLVLWSQVTGPAALVQAQMSSGASALVRFRVTALARLTS